MIRKTLVHLVSLGLLCSLVACSESPEDIVSPSSSASDVAPSTPSETSEMTPSSPPSEDPEAPVSPSSEASQSDESASAEEIPTSLRGKWVPIEDGEKAGPCTEEQEAEGWIIEIDATKIGAFAWMAELESVEESDDTSIQGTFTYMDDSDEPLTQQVKLETQDDGQTLVYSELGEDAASPPTHYGRCPQ